MSGRNSTSWSKFSKTEKNNPQNDSKEIVLSDSKGSFEKFDENSLSVSNSKIPDIKLFESPLNASLIKAISGTDKCATLFRKKNTDIFVEIIEIGIAEIKYKNCNSITDEIICIKKEDVVGIKYSDENFQRFQKEEVNDKDSCSIILIRNASELRGKIIEVGPTSVKYIPCHLGNDSILTIDKSKVEGILYSNGYKEYFPITEEKTSAEPEYFEKSKYLKTTYLHSHQFFFGKKNVAALDYLSKDYNQDKLKTHPKANLALLFSMLGFLPIIGWIFAHVAIRLSRKSLDAIRDNPGTFKGARKAVIANNLAFISLILGAVCLVGLILLSSLGV